MENKLKIGILYPRYSAEDDYPRLAAALEPCGRGSGRPYR